MNRAEDHQSPAGKAGAGWRLVPRLAALVVSVVALLVLPPDAGAISADPMAIDFGVVPVGATVSQNIAVTIAEDFRMGNAYGLGTAPPFDFDFDTCSRFAGPGTCNVVVSFAPTFAHSYSDVVLGLTECHPSGDACDEVRRIEVLLSATAVRVATTTTLVSSVNPSVVGDTVTLMASVAPVSGATTPTGTVVFRDGASMLASVALTDGSASFATSSLSAGAHTISASYQGSPAFEPSSRTLTQTVLDAPALLDILLGEVTSLGPGISLADKIRQIQAHVAAGDTRAACRLLSAFIAEVSAQSGKSLTTAEAAELIGAAEQIRRLIGC